MADMRIDRNIISVPEDYGEVPSGLGLSQESTSMPEWQGWDRLENAGALDAAGNIGFDLKPDIGMALDQLRSDPDYSGMADLDEKTFLLDSMNTISGKLDGIVEEGGSDKLLNFRETFNELLDLYNTAYTHQVANIKG